MALSKRFIGWNIPTTCNIKNDNETPPQTPYTLAAHYFKHFLLYWNKYVQMFYLIVLKNIFLFCMII